MDTRTLRVYSENNDFQYLETLKRRREKRQRERRFLLEGVRPINQALDHGWTIHAWISSRERDLSDWARGLLRDRPAAVHYDLPLPLLRKLSAKTETSELLALAGIPPDDLARIPLEEDLLVVVFDRPASPGNLGTLIRSCDALGVHGLVVTGHAVDVYDPETISATTGSLFAVPVVRVGSPRALVPWLETVHTRLGDVQLIGSSANAKRDVADARFDRPTVLVVGNETWGISAAYRDMCDALVRIPMSGSATSLNVACAASIMLYEIDRQRRLKGQA